ncbi:MAG TPA: transketolase C-terminal domain-containing protein [Dehalococcoidales bacterium]|nr:transketolase C-terminal domain-containing protein [Dehalococcoidales bacterium]
MPQYNQYIQIEKKPSMPAVGIEKALIATFKNNPDCIAVLEDMGFPGIGWFVKNLPEQMIETGIAEQNGAGVAAGLAAEGFIPVINSFWFANIGRAYNQVRQSILVDRFNVKFIGREGVWGDTGISHNTVEGIAASRVLPNLVILNPADEVEAEKAAAAMMQYVGPVLLRQESSPMPYRIFTNDMPYDIGKGIFIKDGKDAVIISTGYMTTEAINAVELAEKEKLDIGILHIGTIKPLDVDAIVKAAEMSGAIVVTENASEIGGLGEGTAAILAEHLPTPMLRVAVEDEFSQSGKITPEKDDLKEHFALRAEDILVSVKEVIAKKKKLAKKSK